MKIFKLAFEMYAGVYVAKRVCPTVERAVDKVVATSAKRIYEKASADKKLQNNPIVRRLEHIVKSRQPQHQVRKVKVHGFYN